MTSTGLFQVSIMHHSKTLLTTQFLQSVHCISLLTFGPLSMLISPENLGHPVSPLKLNQSSRSLQ